MCVCVCGYVHVLCIHLHTTKRAPKISSKGDLYMWQSCVEILSRILITWLCLKRRITELPFKGRAHMCFVDA